ncbi:MAG TPA: hypothetical protein VM204_00280 [Gaiellaceae bacterium]|nr:hypothetical protein [Gaiellaceae bacterium]
MTFFAALAGAAVLLPAAAAATPADIAADLADGRLDGTYTRAELEAYMRDAMVQGYGRPELPPPLRTPPKQGVAGQQGPVVVKRPNQPSQQPQQVTTRTSGVAGQQSPVLGETRQVGSLPFTGLDLALLVVGGTLLLLLGLGARRLGRDRA